MEERVKPTRRSSYLIQAYHFEPRQVPEQYLVWKIRDDWTPNLGDSAITGQYEQVVETRWVWKNVPVYDEHDGMVGNHSSQIPTYQAPLLIRNIEVKGVNHMEMSGHIEMRDELYNILHFGNGYDRVFDPSYN